MVNVGWLQRSLICESNEPKDLSSLSSTVAASIGQYTIVKELSCCKFILTFPNTLSKEEALRNCQELEQWFTAIRKWDSYDQPDVRRTWIKVFGIPPHGWLRENFTKIANIWGTLVCLGEPVELVDSFESMKMLIVTEQRQRMEAEILLYLEHSGYRVMVKEIDVGPHDIQMAKCKSTKFSHLDTIPSSENCLLYTSDAADE